MKTETLQEYLARGGKITRVESSQPEPQVETIKSTTSGLPTVMTLQDGALFFSESNKKSVVVVSRKELADRLGKSKLPADVIASLKRSMGVKDEDEGK